MCADCERGAQESRARGDAVVWPQSRGGSVCAMASQSPSDLGRGARRLSVFAAALIVAGCTAAVQQSVAPSVSPDDTSIPSATASASATPPVEPASPSSAPGPTPAFEAPDDILPPGSRAMVTLDGLRIRSAPGFDAVVDGTLAADTVVEVHGWGPTVVDGIDWYFVVHHDAVLAGYAAAGSGGDRYLDLLPPRCEEREPDRAVLARLTPWERLACFGDRSLTVTGTYGCPVCGEWIPGSYEPSWLANPQNLNYLGWPEAIALHFPPEAGLNAPPNASIVRVTGHFSDPASTTCVIELGAMPVDPVVAELWCREQFVVDSYEITGTDPDFSYPPSP